MIERLKARNGELTVSFRGRSLHSRFDPRREATRYTESLEIGSPRSIVLIGAGAGYVLAALQERYPKADLLGIYLDESIRHVASDLGLASVAKHWAPGNDQSFDEFLAQSLSELQTLSVAVVEWPAGAACDPVLARRLAGELTVYVRRAQGSILSEGAQGPLRIRNAIINLSRIPTHQLTPSRSQEFSAAVVLASGPSLERALPHLAASRERLLLICTGSALEALARARLQPDLVVITESSVYSALHLHPLVAGALASIPIAAPVSVCTSVTSLSNPCVFFSQGEIAESLAPTLPSLRLPRLGSVTLTALALARSLTSAPVVAAGLDLAWFEDRSHARPHLAHTWHAAAQSRKTPHSARAFIMTRSHEDVAPRWTQDRSLRTYAEWLAGGSLSGLGPIYSLMPSPVLKTILPQISADDLAGLPARHTAAISLSARSHPSAGREQLRDVLRRWWSVIAAARDNTIPDGEPKALFSSLAIRELMTWASEPESPVRGRAARDRAAATLERLEELVDHVAS